MVYEEASDSGQNPREAQKLEEPGAQKVRLL
jgi:hypothetical protein